MKIGLIYTSTTPELIDSVEQAVKQAVGNGVELISKSDPDIIKEVREDRLCAAENRGAADKHVYAGRCGRTATRCSIAVPRWATSPTAHKALRVTLACPLCASTRKCAVKPCARAASSP